MHSPLLLLALAATTATVLARSPHGLDNLYAREAYAYPEPSITPRPVRPLPSIPQPAPPAPQPAHPANPNPPPYDPGPVPPYHPLGNPGDTTLRRRQYLDIVGELLAARDAEAEAEEEGGLFVRDAHAEEVDVWGY